MQKNRHQLYYEANRERIKARQREYYRENRKRIRDKSRKYRIKSGSAIREQQRQHYRDNRDEILARNQRYRDKHPYKAAARMALLRNRKQTPPYVDPNALEDIYALADLMRRLLDRAYEVDHIIPIRHSRVCGLHTPNNLQVIRADCNRRKSNTLLL